MTEKIVCLVMTTAVLVAAQADLFVALSEFRYERKRCIIATAIFSLLIIAVCVLGAAQNNYDRTAEWTIVSCMLPMLIFFFILSQYRGIRFFATFCIAVVSVALVDFFSYLLVLFLFDGNYTVDWIVRGVLMTSWSLATRLIVGERWRKALALLHGGWWLILITVGGMYCLMCLLAAYPSPVYMRPASVPVCLVIVLVMILCILMGIRMVYTTLAAREQREKSQALQNQLAIAKNQYAMLNENIAQIRRLRHDMKYHIGVIYGLLQQEDYEQLRVYMRQYYDQLTLLDTSLPIYTQNQTVNILAVYYARQAEEKGIAWQMDFSIPEHLPFDQAHLTVLLGNMWRNALDACEVLPEDTSRFVSTRICIDGNKLIIKCRNSTPSVEIDENGHLVSTKGEGHGTGLSSMEAIIAEHNGFSSIKSENGIFTFAAALEIK